MTLKCFSECQREYDLVTEQLKANNDKVYVKGMSVYMYMVIRCTCIGL